MTNEGSRISLLIYSEKVNAFFTEFYSDPGFRTKVIGADDYTTAIFIGNYFDAILVDATTSDWKSKRHFINIVNSVTPWIPIVVVAPEERSEAGELGARLGVTAMVSEETDFARLKDVIGREIRIRKEAIDRTFVIPKNFERYNRLLEFFCGVLAGDDTEEIMCAMAKRITEEFPNIISTSLEARHANIYYCCSRTKMSDGFMISLKSRVLNLFNDMTDSPPAKPAGIVNRVEILDENAEETELFQYLCSVPVLEDNRLTGLLTISSARGQSAESDSEMIIIFTLMRQLCLLLSSFNKLRSRMIHDSLTGLYDHQYFQRTLRLQFDSAREKDGSLGLLLLDLDRFKNFNDSYGHFVGDEVLKDFAELLASVGRRQDVVARFGGDEFAVVMPNTSREDVRRLALALLEKVRGHVFKSCGHPLSFTISIGMATTREANISSASALFEAADAALYLAKKNGRNQLCCNYDMTKSRTSFSGAAKMLGAVIRKAWSGLGKEAAETIEEGPQPQSASVSSSGRTVELTAPRGHILIVDDNQDILTLMSRTLELRKYSTLTAPNGVQALEIIRSAPQNIDLIISDLNMPEMDGLALIQAVRNIDPNLVVILLTGFATVSNSLSALKAGAFRIIRKPFETDELIQAVESGIERCNLKRRLDAYHLHLEEMLQQKTKALQLALEQLKESFVRTMAAVVSILDAHEQNTATHSQVVSLLSVRLAEAIGIDGKEALSNIRYGSLLHDIGKLSVPTSILNKPGKLSEDEMKLIRQHPRKGYEIARNIPFLDEASEIIYQHHEHFDGSGYPRGLKGEEICFGARIFAVIDAFEAMRSSQRSYKEEIPLAEVVRELNRCSGTQFDPVVIKAFNNCCEDLDALFKKYHRRAAEQNISELTSFISQPLD